MGTSSSKTNNTQSSSSPSREDISLFSKSLKLNQSVAIFGHEYARSLDDDQEEQKNNEKKDFNFWLCRVEEKDSEQHDSLLNCYGTNSKSGIFYFWLLRGLGENTIHHNDNNVNNGQIHHEKETSSINSSSSSSTGAELYKIRSPSKQEVEHFSDRAVLNFLVSEKSEEERKKPLKSSVNEILPRELVEKGYSVLDTDEVGSYYGKQVMKDFMLA